MNFPNVELWTANRVSDLSAERSETGGRGGRKDHRLSRRFFRPSRPTTVHPFVQSDRDRAAAVTFDREQSRRSLATDAYFFFVVYLRKQSAHGSSKGRPAHTAELVTRERYNRGRGVLPLFPCGGGRKARETDVANAAVSSRITRVITPSVILRFPLVLFQVGMERRDVILTAVFGTVIALAILVGLALAMWLYLRARKSKQRDDDLEEQNDNDGSGQQQQPAKKNGFLNLKTPLISTKALG